MWYHLWRTLVLGFTVVRLRIQYRLEGRFRKARVVANYATNAINIYCLEVKPIKMIRLRSVITKDGVYFEEFVHGDESKRD